MPHQGFVSPDIRFAGPFLCGIKMMRDLDFKFKDIFITPQKMNSTLVLRMFLPPSINQF
jgi:hypothetical protein